MSTMPACSCAAHHCACIPSTQVLTAVHMQVNQFAQNINIANIDVTVVNTALTNLVQLSSGGGSVNINQVRQTCPLLSSSFQLLVHTALRTGCYESCRPLNAGAPPVLNTA